MTVRPRRIEMKPNKASSGARMTGRGGSGTGLKKSASLDGGFQPVHLS